MSNIYVGQYIKNVKCILVYDNLTYKRRVKALPDQNIPTDLFIECSKSIREKYPLGTKFLAKTIKVCQKPGSQLYLRAEEQIIYLIVE